MKILQLLGAYTKGIRLQLLVLALMMLVALLLGVFMMSQVSYIRYNQDILASCVVDPELVIFRYEFGARPDGFGGTNSADRQALMEKLQADPAVQGLYTTWTAQMVTYQKESVTVIPVDPGLPELFPVLEEMGIGFSEPDGVILADPLFARKELGGELALTFRRPELHEEAFPVVGKLQYPYRILSFNGAATKVKADHLFDTVRGVLISGTQENMDRLAALSVLRSSPYFLVALRPGTSLEYRDGILRELKEDGMAVTLGEILENTEAWEKQIVRERLPLPLFLLCISSFAFFSTVILIFKKKEKELAIAHLCGGSRWTCNLLVLLTFALTALVPTALAFWVIQTVPEWEWKGIVQLNDMVLDWRCTGLVAGYFLVTQALAVGAAWLQMRGHTPLGLLKGVQK